MHCNGMMNNFNNIFVLAVDADGKKREVNTCSLVWEVSNMLPS